MTPNGKIQLYPILRIALSIFSGMITGDAFYGQVSLRLWFAFLLSVFILCLVLRKKPLVCSIMIFAAFFLSGASMLCYKRSVSECELPMGIVECQAVVSGKPQYKGKTIRCDLIVIRSEQTIKVRTAFYRDNRAYSLKIGDGIKAFMSLDEPHNYIKSSFDYRKYLYDHGYSATAFLYPNYWYPERVDLSPLTLADRVRIFALRLRDSLLDMYKTDEDGNSEAVISAMVFGDKSTLTESLKEAYSVSGASHVLALSGLHLGVIYGLLSLLFVHHRMRVLGQVLAMVVIWAYATLVGMPPSVLRSATMLTIFAFVVLTGRRQVSLNTLAFAAVVQLAINPLGLWDVGFQMSFLAVLGIVMLNLRLRDVATPIWLSRWRVIRWMWSLVKVSLAAQIAVAPLSMYYFGTFPCYFLLTNLIAVPLAMLILYSSVVMYLLVFWVWMQGIVAKCIGWMATLMNTSLGFIASLPGACMYGIHINARQVWLMYALLLVAYLMSFYIERRNITTASRSALDKL